MLGLIPSFREFPVGNEANVGSMGLFWGAPQKRGLFDRGPCVPKHRHGFVGWIQVELSVEVGGNGFAEQESQGRPPTDFLGVDPKKVPPFLAPQKSQKSPPWKPGIRGWTQR
jgi:hypothetical protein